MLNYPFTERTRLRVRIEVRDVSHDDPARVLSLRHLTTTEACQRAYIAARDESGLGVSRFGSGEVFDEAGQHLATISYNGRLWPPLPWRSYLKPLAEAPA